MGLRGISLVILAGLVVWGTIHPMSYFIAWFETYGYALGPMVDAWYVNDASSGLVWDLTIAAIALSLWAIYAAFRQSLVYLVVILATFGIGVSCGLPLMLFLQLWKSPDAQA